MAKEQSTEGKDENKAGPQGVSVQRVPSGQSDQPILANVTSILPTQGIALVDFGFLEPGAVNALSRLAKAVKKVPERVNGRLAVRVALSYDVLAGLHRQIGTVLQAVAAKPKS